MEIMTKYEKLFAEMLKQNQAAFESFKKTHDLFVGEPKKYSEIFYEEREKIRCVIRRYENQLCSHADNSGFGKYTMGLSDKFWGKVRELYPKIDEPIDKDLN